MKDFYSRKLWEADTCAAEAFYPVQFKKNIFIQVARRDISIA